MSVYQQEQFRLILKITGMFLGLSAQPGAPAEPPSGTGTPPPSTQEPHRISAEESA